MDIRQRLSTAFHPETDGSTERMNQVVEEYLRCFTTYFQENWSFLLPTAMLAINNRPASSTEMSPFFATHRYNIDPIQIKERLRADLSSKSPIERGEAFVSRLQEASDIAQACIAQAQESQETYANRRQQTGEALYIGDKVWLNIKNIKIDRPAKKLDWLHYKYTVVETIGSYNVRLDTLPRIHNIFYTMLLKGAANNPLSLQKQDN